MANASLHSAKSILAKSFCSILGIVVRSLDLFDASLAYWP
jgi:hypothetical protein